MELKLSWGFTRNDMSSMRMTEREIQGEMRWELCQLGKVIGLETSDVESGKERESKGENEKKGHEKRKVRTTQMKDSRQRYKPQAKKQQLHKTPKKEKEIKKKKQK